MVGYIYSVNAGTIVIW